MISYGQKNIEELRTTGRFVQYLRKSREDKDGDTLEKHRSQLAEFIKRQGFENVTAYEEVGSADSIDERPVFKMVLEKIEAGAFDGIIVVHADRLTRGSQIDAGRISNALKTSNTLIITPTKTFDLVNNESDEMMFEMETFVARQEYRAIKRRLQQGKTNGVKAGRWSNGGRPPFPYYYDRNERLVKIDEDQLQLYKYIIRLFIEEYKSTEEIARILNKKGIPTITGKGRWRQAPIRNLLVSEFHLGYVFRFQIKRTGNKCVPTPQQTIKSQGLHEPVKSMEEHVLILKRFEESRRISHGARRGTFILSGLIRCNKCGKGMSFRKDQLSDGFGIYLRKCRRMLDDGLSFCEGNKGIDEKILLEEIYHQMKKYREELFAKDQDETPEVSEAKILIEVQQKEMKKAERRLERIKEMYIDGDIEKAEFQSRKEREETKIFAAKNEIARLQESFDLIDNTILKERKKRWKEIDLESLFDLSNDLSEKDRNTLLKTVISEVNYERMEDEVFIKVKWN